MGPTGDEYESVQRAHDLADFRARWGNEFDIGWDRGPDEAGEFVARRRVSGLTAFSSTANGLHRALMFNRSVIGLVPHPRQGM
jgi:hypothetical protein